MEKEYETYLDDECHRIKGDVLKEFDRILIPLEKSIQKIDNELGKLEGLISYDNIYAMLSSSIS